MAPGNAHLWGALTPQAASSVVEVTEILGSPIVTPAYGAGFAVGVTATDRAPPRVQANLRNARTLIHSPVQPSRPSGSMSHTRPRLRS